MRLIDADALMREFAEFVRESNNSDFADVPTWNNAVSLVDCAPTVDAVKATMPWTNPDGTETMLDEVSYEIGYSQGQKDTTRQGLKVSHRQKGADNEID